MDGFCLGIDLGTSSVKALARNSVGRTVKAKQVYDEQSLKGWEIAVKRLIGNLIEQMPNTEIKAVAFSSQVGSYIVEDDVIGWQSSAGKEELKEIKSKIAAERFVNEIGMRHPDIISYPLPRLLYIQRRYGAAEVLQPKDYFIREFTGKTLTDAYSLRGIVNLRTGKRADDLAWDLGINCKLPNFRQPWDLAGVVTEAAEKKYGLKRGTPVYLGCNDFFAGLLGMGVLESGTAFDMSGTSEHVGYISDTLQENASVSGSYFSGYCNYGGTKSSGSSCGFAIENFGIEGLELSRSLKENPPIFLPYLSGERAPIYDENARGVYFGLNASTTKERLAYATLEGVTFSLYDIASAMSMPKPKKLICGGGSAVNPLMNSIKAEIFDCPVVRVKENDASALGACMMAKVGVGEEKTFADAILNNVEYAEEFLPVGEYRDTFLRRFEIYKELYKNLKGTFEKFNRIGD